MRWLRVLTVLALACTLMSCRAARSDFSYLDEPTVLQLCGEVDGLAFRAELRGAGRDTENGHLRCHTDFVLVYHEPSALSGLTVTYTAADDRYTVRMGEVSVSGDEYAALGEVGRIILTEQAVQSRVREGDTLHLRTADGVLRTHDAQSGLPVELVFRRGRVQIQ